MAWRGGHARIAGKGTGQKDCGMTTALEERIAHLMRAVDDLSEIVAQQAVEIERLGRRVGMLLEREAEREAEGGGIPLADQRPPHW